MTSLRPRAPRQLFLTLSAVALGAGLLGGCSVAGTDFQPGRAATVGDQFVRSSEVDRLTTAACAAFGPQLAAENQVLPLRLIKTTVAQNLALSSAVRQLGEEFDVRPGQAYLDGVEAAVPPDADLGDDEREAAVLVSGTNALVSDVLGQIGAQLGDDPATSEEAVALGGEELTGWLARNEVELDPQYGIAVTDTGAETTDTSLAFPVSEAARAGAAGADAAPDPAATMALPSTQRCGSYAATGGLG